MFDDDWHCRKADIARICLFVLSSYEVSCPIACYGCSHCLLLLLPLLEKDALIVWHVFSDLLWQVIATSHESDRGEIVNKKR